MTSYEQIQKALSFIPAHDRDTWLRMGMAVKAELGDGGFTLWDEWSRTADNYKAGDAKDVWRSIKQDGGITVGSLFAMAKQFGWNGQAGGGDRKPQEDGAARARAIWEDAPPAPNDHSYLFRKGIQSYGLRLYRGPLKIAGMNCDGALLVPINNANGELQSLEFISQEEIPENKRFLPKGKKAGNLFLIGDPGNVILVSEGYADAASLYEATSYAAAIAFDAGNVRSVVEALRSRYPDARILACIDNDAAGAKAGRSLSGIDRVKVIPPPEGFKDFHEVYGRSGIEAVESCIKAALEGLDSSQTEESITDDPESQGWDRDSGTRRGESGDSGEKAHEDSFSGRRQRGEKGAVDAIQADLEALYKEACQVTVDKVKPLLKRVADAHLGRSEQESILRKIKQATGVTLKALRGDLVDCLRGAGVIADKESVATRLVELALESGIELWHDPEQNPWVTLKFSDHVEHHSTRTKAVRRYLQGLFYKEGGNAAHSEGVQAALGVLEAKAVFEGEERPVYVRVAEIDSTIYLDLGNDQWEVVAATVQGWRVIPAVVCPVRFRRSRGMRALPAPAAPAADVSDNKTQGGTTLKGMSKVRGTLGRFPKILNVERNSREWKLVIGWLLGALRGHIPYPLLVLNGEQDSGKSTTAKLLRALIDPNITLLRTPPKETRDLFIAASNSWVQCFDNVSGLSDWLSDDLCRLATGGGLATRELYSDNEETLLDVMRPCILNGITDFVTKPDLVDRSMLVTLESIPEDRRKLESQIIAEFEAIRPRLLGALFDVVVEGLRRLPNTTLNKLPRMADFALWVTACEPSLGWKQGDFVKAFKGARKEMIASALEAEPIVEPLRQLARQGEWKGNATDLFKKLTGLAGIDATKRLPDGWPKNEKSLARKLIRLAPALRTDGINVVRLPREENMRLWRVGMGRERNVSNVINVSDAPDKASRHDITNDVSRQNVSNVIETSAVEPAPDKGHDVPDVSDVSFPTLSNGERDTYISADNVGIPEHGEGRGEAIISAHDFFEDARIRMTIMHLNGRPVDGLRFAELLGRTVESITPALDELARRGLIKPKGVSWLTSPVILQVAEDQVNDVTAILRSRG